MRTDRPGLARAVSLAALTVAALAAGFGASAQTKPTFAQVSQATAKVAEAYFAAYVARDWDRLAPLMAPAGSFSDPTARIVFGSLEHRGGAAVLAFFRESYAGLSRMNFHRTRAFFSGDVAVFEGKLDWTLQLGEGKEVVVDGMPFVTTLKVEDGQVVEHRDLADYHAFTAAYRKVVPGP